MNESQSKRTGMSAILYVSVFYFKAALFLLQPYFSAFRCAQ